MNIKAYVADNARYELRDVQLLDLDPDEVLIKIVGTGLCYMDLSVLHGLTPTPMPIVLGHEGAGIVEKVGSVVTGLEEGDHVVVSLIIADMCQLFKRCTECL